MQSTIPALAVPLPTVPLLFSPTSLYARFCALTDQRDPRGVRYPLAALLTIATLAKLAEQNRLRAIAHWAQLRAVPLAALFGLSRPTMPHPTTWSRVLGGGVDPTQVAHVVADFLAAAMPTPGKRRRGTLALCLDGKTLCGTIPAGMTRGVHLLAAYLPNEGIVLCEVEVGSKENESVAAERVISCLDVRGMVVTGDAMFAQRALSRQVRGKGGDYLWCIKENQPDTHAAIALLFETPPLPALPGDFTTATRVDAGHGRYEERTLTASTLLARHLDWPSVAQVFRLERRTLLAGGTRRDEVAYGITSLPPRVADAQRLLALARGHWGIENGLFYRRDATLGEDHSLLRCGSAPQVLASIHDLVLGLMVREGKTNLAAARREYAAFPDRALALLIRD